MLMANSSFMARLTDLQSPAAFQRLLGRAVRQKWVVYAKRPFAGPRQVLAISRDTLTGWQSAPPGSWSWMRRTRR